MPQVDLPSLWNDPRLTIKLELVISADPDSPAGIGEMLICLATCAEHYGHHRVMAASRRNSLWEKREERMLMKRSLRNARRWLDELLPRLRSLKSDEIKDRIPVAGPFLCDAGKLAERIYADMRFDWILLPERRRIAREFYKRPGDPGWDPLDNSFRKFGDDARAVESRMKRLAATLRDDYGNNLRQVATSGESTDPNGLITARQASEIWCTSTSWWKTKVGDSDDAPIRVRGIGKNGAKLFRYLDADQYAKSQDPPIERLAVRSS